MIQKPSKQKSHGLSDLLVLQSSQLENHQKDPKIMIQKLKKSMSQHRRAKVRLTHQSGKKLRRGVTRLKLLKMKENLSFFLSGLWQWTMRLPLSLLQKITRSEECTARDAFLGVTIRKSGSLLSAGLAASEERLQ